jgi:NAD(P) transhydrogenase subunit alpha
VVAHGVTIIGPDNLAATIPHHGSQMFGKNIETLLEHLLNEENQLNLDFEDEIIFETVVAHGGDVPHKRMRELLGYPSIDLGESIDLDADDDTATEQKEGGAS